MTYPRATCDDGTPATAMANERADRWQARCENAHQRLDLARRALIATGYFTPEQVGEDIAPRITELYAALTQDPS